MNPSPDPDRPDPAAALGVHLHYRLAPGAQRGAAIGNPLFELLQAVADAGSITHAARQLGCSYRHAWGSLREWEHTLGASLLVWVRGQPARLTPYAQRLLWAERRARTRMQPHLEALRADLAQLLAEAGDERQPLVTVCASHDLALPALQRHAAQAQLTLDLRFLGSVTSLRALNAGQCHVAGFHVPLLGGAAPVFARALKPLLKPGRHKLMGCSRRRQGLMLRREDAGAVRSLADLPGAGLRFVQREEGSGTRLLVDHLLHEHRLPAAALITSDACVEHTHVAVAASIASGAADVGVGLEAAALEFGLAFVPLVEEDYFLVCLKERLDDPALQRLRALLADAAWARTVTALPGYRAAPAPGAVLAMTAALPWWRYANRRCAPAAAGGRMDAGRTGAPRRGAGSPGLHDAGASPPREAGGPASLSFPTQDVPT